VNETKQAELAARYPQIFQSLGGDPRQTLMAFGIETGDGWYDLIDVLCSRIMQAGPPAGFKADQVKEKFGGLRFYASPATDEILDLIEAAEEESYLVCEQCGSRAGVTSEGSWLATRCASCRSST
jgi:hypothetical protein